MNKTHRGFLGENLGITYLLQNQYRIIVRNFRRKWGEIDIVAYDKKTKETVFLEVKTIIEHSFPQISPEEELTERKIKKLKRVILSFLSRYHLEDKPWRFDLLAIAIQQDSSKSDIRHYKDVYLEF